MFVMFRLLYRTGTGIGINHGIMYNIVYWYLLRFLKFSRSPAAVLVGVAVGRKPCCAAGPDEVPVLVVEQELNGLKHRCVTVVSRKRCTYGVNRYCTVIGFTRDDVRYTPAAGAAQSVNRLSAEDKKNVPVY